MKKLSKKKILLIGLITIIVLVVSLYIALRCLVYLAKNNMDFDYGHQHETATVTVDKYCPTEEFLNLETYEKYKSDIGHYDGDIEKINQTGTQNCILLNDVNELEKIQEEIGDFSSSYIKDIEMDEEYFKNGSLIIYFYGNNDVDTHIANVKITDVRKNNDLTDIDIAISEGEALEIQKTGDYFTDYSNSYSEVTENECIIYILTDKINDMNKMNFNITKYNAEIKEVTKEIYLCM